MTKPDEIVEEMQRLEEKRSPGEWVQEPDTGAGRVWVQRIKNTSAWSKCARILGAPDCEPLFNVREGDGSVKAATYKQREHDAAFICGATRYIPHSLKLIAELREEVERLEYRCTVMTRRVAELENLAGKMRSDFGSDNAKRDA